MKQFKRGYTQPDFLRTSAETKVKHFLLHSSRYKMNIQLALRDRLSRRKKLKCRMT